MKTHSSANCILITLVDTKYELFPSALLGIITAYMNDIVHTYGNKLGHCRYLSGTSKGTGRGSKDLFFLGKELKMFEFTFIPRIHSDPHYEPFFYIPSGELLWQVSSHYFRHQ